MHIVATAAAIDQLPGCRPIRGGAQDPEAGVTYRCRRDEGRPAPYYLHLPREGAEGAPVLVAVHGISRNAREQVQEFGQAAARQGFMTIAPVFSKRAFPSYQRLGVSSNGIESSPQDALGAILAEVARTTGADTKRVFMFGFSGGAQFAHRYALRYPHKVRSLVLGAAGWYTFPDTGIPYPRGLGGAPLELGIDAREFLKVPALVLVGELDRVRDEALNTSRRLDREQGRTRIERGRRWVAAMRLAAATHGHDVRHEFALMRGCGHSFTQCALEGEMVSTALEFLLASTKRAARTDGDGQGEDYLLFSAAVH